MRILWLLWLVPVAGGLLSYAGLRRGWPQWLALTASAGHALPVWLAVLALAYLRGYRHPLALAPFAAALVAAMVVEPVLRLRVSALEEQGQLHRPRARVRLPVALGAVTGFLAATIFLWLAGDPNRRLLGALLALGLALLLAYWRLERRATKPKPGVDPERKTDI